MTNEKKIKIGIIGIGNMGSVHVDHVIDLNNTELAAVCDIDEEKLQAVTDKIEVPAFASYQDMLNSVELDGIVIATPHYSHPDITLAAFAKGINVLVEKPIAVHVNDAQRMIDGYNEARKTHPNLIFEAMFMQRTYGHWRKIKEMIDSGELGQLIRTTWIITDWFRTQYYYDSGDWRATWGQEGGGVLMNQCPHNLDLYQWLVGMPKHVHGFVTFGKHHNIEVEDEVTGYFEHENGMVGHFITTTGESPGTNRLEIVGENGKLVYENGEIVFYRNAWSSIKQIQESDKGFERVKYEKEVVEFEHHGTGGHELIIENFADAILNDAILVAPAPEGLPSVMINNSIILSAHKKQTITLPIDGAEYEALLQEYIEEAAK
jgi:predicted dehydrogenase